MADETQQQQIPSVQVITASQTPSADPAATLQALVDIDKTRKLVVILVFAQFNLFVVGTVTAMILKGWELSNVTNSIFIMILQFEIAAVTTAVGYYLGSSQGSQMKSMVAALSQKP